MLIFSLAEMLNKLTAEQTVPGIRAPGPLFVDYGCLVLIRYELKFDDRLLSKSFLHVTPLICAAPKRLGISRPIQQPGGTDCQAHLPVGDLKEASREKTGEDSPLQDLRQSLVSKSELPPDRKSVV